jgi:hypothetical protein
MYSESEKGLDRVQLALGPSQLAAVVAIIIIAAVEEGEERTTCAVESEEVPVGERKRAKSS